MIRDLKLEFVQIITIALFFAMCVMLLKLDDTRTALLFKKTTYIKSFISPNCSCSDKDGNTYNFCYTNPNNSTMIGKRFGCKHLEAAKELGLFDMDYIDLSRDEMTDPQFVTAISGNHILEGRRQLQNLHSRWPNKKIVVFDLELGEYRKEYERNPLVDLRDFPFKQFPACVNNLEEYRWKPIIITMMLKEFGAIFYIDSSIIFHDSDLSPVYSLFRCKNKNNRAAGYNKLSYPKYLNNQTIDEIVKSCNKSSYLFHHDTFHSIFAATLAGTYDYLPMNMNLSKSLMMYEAGIVTVVRTKEAVENILKWYVLCALEGNCMGPPGAQLKCKFNKKDYLTEFGQCHRYDQSVINILSANLYNGNLNIYGSGIYGYLSVNRIRDPSIA